MTNPHTFLRTALSRDPRLGYLPDEDRYLSAPIKPTHKINIIGAGINGQEHIRVALLEGRTAVNGVFDPNPHSIEAAQREAARYGQKEPLVVYDTLAGACHDPAADALIICTPNFTHREVVEVAAQSGKHILLEKPVATTVPDAHAIWQIAEDYPAVFQVGLQYRFKPHYVEALHEIRERRTLGDVKTISMVEHRIPFLDKVDQWNKFARFSGDTLVEKCCHYFDLINLIAGARPTRVFATGGTAVYFRDFERDGARSDILDNAHVIINYANGITASFDLCMFAPLFVEELVVCGDGGRLKAAEYEDFLPHERPATTLEIAITDHRPSRTSHPMYPQLIQQTGHLGATFIEHIAFVDQISGADAPTATATAADGFWSIVVAAAAQESIATSAPIPINAYLANLNIDA